MISKKLHFTFLDDFITYNCNECQGVCCHVNNHIVLDTYSTQKIKNKYSSLSDFISQYNGVNMLNCGKNCWFLSNKGCIVGKLGLNKPPTCQLYPLQILDAEEYLIISYRPCPSYDLGSNKQSIRYNDSEVIVKKYIETGVAIRKFTSTISDKRIREEVEYQEKFKKDILLKMFHEGLELELLKKYNYYLEVRWNQQLMNCPIKMTLGYWELYKKICNNVGQNFKFLDESNAVHIIANDFFNQIKKKDHLKIIK